ncbi:MAG TPA: DUF1269 domain-containing protein [Gaiellaceae bacterium]|nr:DUF1269 domain-containing protein [Gaiellaceae bacterium]
MKVIGITVKSQERGEAVLEALRIAVAAERISLDDLALVTNDGGSIHIQQTKDLTPGKGAKRGGLLGALLGFAAPPLLGAAAVGAGVGALWGKLRDRGVDDELMESVGEMIDPGESVVFALGDDPSIDAILDRLSEVHDADIAAFTIDEALAHEAAERLPATDELDVQIPRP